jgi:AmiR/NasT family two-component response regulator
VRELYRDLLTGLGHQVQVVRTGEELVEACRLLDPDVVLSAARQDGLDGLAAAAAVGRHKAIPFVLVADSFDPPCVAGALATENVVACLGKTADPSVLATTLALAARRFAVVRELMAEVAALQRSLEERKAVERAKEAVALRLQVPEFEAFRRLRSAASCRNRKLAEVAAEILAAEGVFAGLDGERRSP